MFTNPMLDKLRTLTPRQITRGLLLVVLSILWLGITIWTFRVPVVNQVSQYDLVWPIEAGKALFRGGDPYGNDIAIQLSGDPNHSSFPYPLPSLWIVLPLLPLPIPLAAAIWLTLSIAALIAFFPLSGSQLTRWTWVLPLLYYPSVFALKFTQWAPIQMGLFACSLWLFRKKHAFWAGFLLPLAIVKPTTGLGLALFALIVCWENRKWWLGGITGTLIWGGIPFLLRPDWIQRWNNTLNTYGSQAEKQNLLALTATSGGMIIAVCVCALGIWFLLKRQRYGFACAVLILAMLATPHRAQYDYPLFIIPLAFLPKRYAWLGGAAIAGSWLFPIAFELGWQSIFPMLLFLIIPTVVCCAFVTDPPKQEQTEENLSPTLS